MLKSSLEISQLIVFSVLVVISIILSCSAIISDLNLAYIHAILNESLEYRIPIINMILTVRKDKRIPRIQEGKLVHTAPPDWHRTMKLWEEDEESRNKKVIVRHLNNHTSGYVYRILGLKPLCTLKNKKYYKLSPSRYFQRELTARIRDEDKSKFDCFLLYNEKR